MQANIERDAKIFLEDGESHCQIICIWQKGANALLEQYRALAKTLPKGDKLETMVVTKDELMKMAMLDYLIQDEGLATANQINAISRNITQRFYDKLIHIYIDECWITIPKKFEAHITKVSYLITC